MIVSSIQNECTAIATGDDLVRVWEDPNKLHVRCDHLHALLAHAIIGHR